MSKQGPYGLDLGDPEALLQSLPFTRKLGIKLTAMTPEEVCGRLRWAADLCTVGGVVHGGALMAFADTLGGVCAFLNLPPGAGTATICSSSNLLHAVRDGEVTATARPLSVGKTVIVVRTDAHDSGGRLVAQVTQAQTVLPGRG